MNVRSILECERKSLMRMSGFQFPHQVKNIGILISVSFFVLLFVNKFSLDLPEFSLISKYGLLAGLLLISLSKDKIEDELITKLRMQSFTVAFVFGVLLTFFQPFLNYGVDYFFRPETLALKETGDFEILWILLSTQVLYFEVLKRMHR